MEQTLLLNATYEPLKVVHWQKAITLWCQGKVEVISDVRPGGPLVSFSFRLPSVIRLLRYIKIKRQIDYVPFSRANIYARDEHTCQYCAEALPSADLTFDHVVPVAQGGRKDWENIVTCCIPCNRRKGGRTPEQAGMHLIRIPQASRQGARDPHHDRAAQRARVVARLLLLEHRTRRRVVTWAGTRASSGPRNRGPPAVGDRGRARHARRRRVPDRSRGAARACRRAAGAPRRGLVVRAHRDRSPKVLEGGLDRRSASTSCRAKPRSSRSARRSSPACTTSTARPTIATAISTSPSADRAGSRRRSRSSSSARTARASRSSATCRTRRRSTFDRDGRLYVSSRFDGSVYRVEADGRRVAVCERSRRRVRPRVRSRRRALRRRSIGLGAARRAGRPRARRSRRCRRAWPRSTSPSVPTATSTSPRRRSARTIPCIASRPTARRSPWSAGFGRPQGLAFDAAGHLYVVDALAGSSGAVPHPPRCAARAGADVAGRIAHRPRLRSARRPRARDQRSGLSARGGAARAVAVIASRRNPETRHAPRASHPGDAGLQSRST